ncbi:FAD-dependent oxidoreductase [Nocardioides dongkuii]|uniref:oxidoreductase n=1 Tax=Nocardioides dongkuii TaxID=2760089 RepID=UPI001C7013F0|nr:FAD-dependent oxidoreductase [Nocardioides dongkuii]
MSTTATGFPHLLRPGRIGSMTTRNRIVMSPMETMYGTPDGLPSERTVAYVAERAAGGVGLITLGATGIDHRHPETPGGLHIGTAESVPAHRRLVEAVHAHGARIQPQVVHAGPDGLGPEMHGATSLGPSVIASYLTGRPSTEMTKAQIAELLDGYRAAVTRVAEAGYDGLELHAAHGYMMIGSFLAPHRNRRTDRYRGSSPEGRLRLLLEVLAAVRAEVDLPVTLRISGYERVAGGRPVWETAGAAPVLVEAGVAAFHVSGGVIDRLVTRMVNGADDGDGLNVGAAAAVRQVVDVPVIAVGRLHDPALAERVLAEGRADFVAMARPLLADPDLPRRLATGQADRVRRCISCENCIDSLEERLAVDCAVNARTGRELELLPGPAARPRHVVVVGGGPAGLEAARVAAGRGHRVTLLERSRRLGGALVWASVVHPENEPFLTWLLAEVARAGVDVRRGVEATPDVVAALSPDAVLVATGARIEVPDLPGADLPHVRRGVDLRERLAGLPGQGLLRPGLLRGASRAWLPVGRRVAIVGGDLVAVELAEFLAGRGRLVTVLEPGDVLAPEVGWKRRTEHMDRLDRLGVTAHAGAVTERVVPGGLVFRPAGGTARELRADTVLLAGEARPDLALHDALAARLPGVPLTPLGDCTGLGLIRGAVESAARAAHAL